MIVSVDLFSRLRKSTLGDINWTPCGGERQFTRFFNNRIIEPEGETEFLQTREKIVSGH
ncbi:MAG: hypothetical protein ACD_75C02213G0001 [uncultured bacterium]|nr:MAG: hypothetical protein ACD_75C02213G0001 [uncultured bacterium]